MQGPGDRPEATFVAVAGDEVVGYAKFSLTEHAADDRPPRPDRRQASLARPRRRPGAEGGADRLGEGERLRAAADANDERNKPMRRLNEQFGYRPWIGRLFLRGPLA